MFASPRLQNEKLTKLKSPNFAVSTTRLAVHNVPKEMTEKQLKALFIAAVKQRATRQQPAIRQVKILVDTEKTTADGKPRPKGAAFVEFTEHQHAVAALRMLNNNPGEHLHGSVKMSSPVASHRVSL